MTEIQCKVGTQDFTVADSATWAEVQTAASKAGGDGAELTVAHDQAGGGHRRRHRTRKHRSRRHHGRRHKRRSRRYGKGSKSKTHHGDMDFTH